MNLATIIGVLGSLLILFAFGMNQMHKWKNDYFVYDLINALGGVLLVIYAILIESYPFMILNLVWSSISIWDVFADWDRNRQRERKDFFSKWLK